MPLAAGTRVGRYEILDKLGVGGMMLFETPFDSAGALHAGYDTGPDGTSFVMIRSEKESTASAIHVVLNWFEELKERAGSR